MNFDDILKDLREQYLKELPEKLALIEKSFNEKNIDLLRSQFHNLKGSGKTYGIPELSELAAVLEKICKEKPQEALNASLRGLVMLRELRAQREKNQAFALEKSEDFHSLKKIAS